MCGIAGIFAARGGRVDGDALREMTAALRARGPDGEGFHIAGPIGLGHRRLAIIDVDGGAQPLHCRQAAISIVVNGEIFNFEALRQDLGERGHQFATRSDSEVIAHGYAEWKDGVLDRIDGQFAIAVWDEPRRRLLLARDRMGEKPLYWTQLPDGSIAFASELRALLRHPARSLTVDPDALARYLVYEYVPAPRSIVEGVYKLPPGHKLVADAGGVQVAPYWDLPIADLADGGRIDDLDAAASRLRDELARSVSERLVADVPLGVFLSGGLDSSLVAALAAQRRPGDIDTFSIAFSDPTYDESGHARRVAQHIGSRHHERLVGPGDLIELIPRLDELMDEPLGDGSLVPTHLLCRFAREQVTVVLGGDGGDELFSGYPTLAAEAIAGTPIDRSPGWLIGPARRAAAAMVDRLPVSHANFSFDFKARQFVRGAIAGPVRRHQAWLGSAIPEEVPALLAPDVAAQVTSWNLFDDAEARVRRCRSSERWDQLLYFYCKGYLGDDVLAKVDRASMAVSLEVRAPLLDRGIIELACQMTPRLRFWGLTGKRVLKRAARGLVPDDIIDRPKKGFGMPIAGWLRGELRDHLEETLSRQRLAEDGLLNPGAVRRLVNDRIAGRANHRKLLWTLLALSAWLTASRR